MGETTGSTLPGDKVGYQCETAAEAKDEEAQVQEADEENAKLEAEAGQAMISTTYGMGSVHLDSLIGVE